jgi:hypothetical protein
LTTLLVTASRLAGVIARPRVHLTAAAASTALPLRLALEVVRLATSSSTVQVVMTPRPGRENSNCAGLVRDTGTVIQVEPTPAINFI